MRRIRSFVRARLTVYFVCGCAGVLLAAPLSADVVPNEPLRPAMPRAELASVSASPAPDAPQEDVARVEEHVHEQLSRSMQRIERCIGDADLREDPLRSRARRMEIHLRVTRSGRAERVWVHRESGIPPSARRCLLEAVRTIAVRPAPRGDVLVRVVYELG
jgi:hypothetical protein